MTWMNYLDLAVVLVVAVYFISVIILVVIGN